MANRYIDPDGDNGGAGTEGDPWQTILSASSQMSAKDTLLFNDGAYLGGWTNWANVKSGDSGGQTIFQAINSQQVVIQTLANQHCVAPPANTDYVTWDGFVIDGLSKIGLYGFTGANTNNTADYGTNLVLKNSEIKNCGASGIQTRASNSLFQNLVIHDVGDLIAHTNHGIYTPGACADNIFEDMLIYNSASNGIQNYDSLGTTAHRNVYRRITIHDCYRNGIWVGSGNDCEAYNILVYGCMIGVGCIVRVGSGHKIYRMSLYGNGGGGMYIYPDPTTLTIRNVLSLGNTSFNFSDNATGATKSNNITSGTAADYWVSPSTGNFNLKPQVAQSPAAIDGGVAIAGITTDLFGRTLNDPPDVGAIEDADPNTYPVNSSDTPYTIATPNTYQSLANVTFDDDEDNVERVTLTASVAALKVNPAVAPGVVITTT